MASNTSAKAVSSEPLSFMTKVSPWVSIYRPLAVAAPSATASPKMIVLLTWMNAHQSHIAKYVRVYQDLYPSAQILLVRNTLKHVILQFHVPHPDVRPAVTIIRAAEIDSQDTSPKLLIHAWSNGGSAMLAHLRAAFDGKLPPHVTVFDSGPGLYSLAHGIAANTVGMSMLMKLAAYPVMTVLSLIYIIMYIGRTNAFTRWFKSHNSGKGEIRRTYIYSKSDKLIDYSMIEKHARDANEKGFRVRLEQFEGTQHVSHVRGDEKRYWQVVQETWKP